MNENNEYYVEEVELWPEIEGQERAVESVNGSVTITKSDSDINEEKAKEKFFTTACCILLCNSKIPAEMIMNARQQMQELSKEEQDLVVIADLKSHCRKEELRAEYSERNRRKNLKEDDVYKRNIIKFYFADLEICKTTYLFINAIGTKRYENLLHHFKQNGIVTRTHALANTSRSWGKTLLPEDIETMVQFIKSVGDQHGMPLPRRLPQFHNFNVTKLPSDITKKSVWLKYKTLPEAKDIAYATFTRIWEKHMVNVEAEVKKRSRNSSGSVPAKKKN